MKKIFRLKNMAFAFMFVLLLSFLGIQIKAYTPGITSLNVVSSESQITVSGTTEEEVTAVSIYVYKPDGSSLVRMKTSSVSDENTYSETIPLEKGTYIVKVSNYEGGTLVTKENVVVGESSETKDNEPKETKNVETNENKKKINSKKPSKTNSKSSKIKNPKTSDDILVFASMISACSLGLFTTFKLRKKSSK